MPTDTGNCFISLQFVVNRLFSDINVSQGSVATYARSGGIVNNHFTANLPRYLPVKTFLNRLRFDRIMAEFGPPCTCEAA